MDGPKPPILRSAAASPANVLAALFFTAGAAALQHGLADKLPGRPVWFLAPAAAALAVLGLAALAWFNRRRGWEMPVERAWLLLAPWGVLTLAGLPLELPQNFNHYIARLRTFANLGLVLWLLGLFFFFRAWMGRRTFPERGNRLRVLGFFLAAFLSLGGLSLQWYRAGDEPLYIMNTQSLVRDHDLNLANNCDARHLNVFTQGLGVTADFSDERNLLLYARVFFHEGTFTKTNGQWSLHSAGGAGLPLLLAPGYLLAGRAGMVAVLALLAALTLWLLYGLLRNRGSGDREAFTLAAGAGLLSPFAFYASHFYPEIPAAFILVLLFTYRRAAPWFGEILLGLAAGYLAWLSTRMLPLLLGMALIRTWVNRDRLPALLPFFAALLAVTAGNAAYNLQIHGSIMNNGRGVTGAEAALYNFFPATTVPTPGRIPATFLAQFLDADFGLIPFYPFLALFLASLASGWRQDPAAGWVLALFLGYTAVISLVPVFGSYCYPARYLTPMVPLLALARPRLGKAAAGLAALGAFWIMAGNVYPGWMLQPTLFTKWGFPFPLLSDGVWTGRDAMETGLWLAVLAAAGWRILRPARHPGPGGGS